MKNSEQVTVNMPKDMHKFLEDRVIRKIRLGEEGPIRASVAQEIRELIRKVMASTTNA